MSKQATYLRKTECEALQIRSEHPEIGERIHALLAMTKFATIQDIADVLVCDPELGLTTKCAYDTVRFLCRDLNVVSRGDNRLLRTNGEMHKNEVLEQNQQSELWNDKARALFLSLCGQERFTHGDRKNHAFTPKFSAIAAELNKRMNVTGYTRNLCNNKYVTLCEQAMESPWQAASIDVRRGVADKLAQDDRILRPDVWAKSA